MRAYLLQPASTHSRQLDKHWSQELYKVQTPVKLNKINYFNGKRATQEVGKAGLCAYILISSVASSTYPVGPSKQAKLNQNWVKTVVLLRHVMIHIIIRHLRCVSGDGTLRRGIIQVTDKVATATNLITNAPATHRQRCVDSVPCCRVQCRV